MSSDPFDPTTPAEPQPVPDSEESGDVMAEPEAGEEVA